jgi:hypothetical protein
LARKPESELTFRDHDVKPLNQDWIRVGKRTFRVGDKVTATDRFRQTVVGVIRNFEYMDTKSSATATVTYLKQPVYYASVEYDPATAEKPGTASIALDVRKLSPAHPELPVGRA